MIFSCFAMTKTDGRADLSEDGKIWKRVARWVHSNTHTYTLLGVIYAPNCPFWVTMKQALSVQPFRTVLMGGKYA